ncbi:MAG: amidohydrolase 2 [Chloroflexi bacterium]|nr:amidohydrolase 2 [Chloroflexota bacterium]
MATPNNRRVIALEEHYMDPELANYADSEDGSDFVRVRLDDLGALRLKEMDEGGIDVQVLSQTAPSTQRLDADIAVALAQRTNDRLYETILQHPDRFAGFACLPTADPRASVDELERTVTQYGFRGAMVHGLCNGLFLDDKRFWPIFERAQDLDVPIYIHPGRPHPAVAEAYYRDYAKEFAGMLVWAFTVETATQAIRIVLSGMLEAYPKVKIILGHLGESLPFSLWRVDWSFSRNLPVSFREQFCRNFYVTTSGNFSTPALFCTMMEMGVDRILFSVDYPWKNNGAGVKWIEEAPISSEDKEKILTGNARRLLHMD